MERKAYNHIDLLRAALILMVILVHIIHFGTLYPRTREVIFVFFMPAFLLITGYLTNVRKSLGQFALYELRILLPYCIMVTGFACLSLYLPVRDGLTELSWASLLRTLCITSIGPYWFLHRMISCALLYWLAFRLEQRIGTMGAFCLLMSMAIMMSLFTPLLPARDAFYYIIGVAIRLFHGDMLRMFRPCAWAWVPFFMLALWANHTRWGEIATMAYVVCFLCGMSAIGNVLPSHIYHRLGYIGRNTLPIYLFHPIFTMAAKYILPAFAFDPSGLLHTATTIMMGTIGSLLIAWGMDRTHLSWLMARERLLR